MRNFFDNRGRQKAGQARGTSPQTAGEEGPQGEETAENGPAPGTGQEGAQVCRQSNQSIFVKIQ